MTFHVSRDDMLAEGYMEHVAVIISGQTATCQQWVKAAGMVGLSICTVFSYFSIQMYPVFHFTHCKEYLCSTVHEHKAKRKQMDIIFIHHV